MGHKVNPIGFRVGINRTWDSRWYAEGQNYGEQLHADLAIRGFLHDKLKQAGLSKVIIERPAKRARITIHTARPGVVIGKNGLMAAQVGIGGKTIIGDNVILYGQVGVSAKLTIGDKVTVLAKSGSSFDSSSSISFNISSSFLFNAIV